MTTNTAIATTSPRWRSRCRGFQDKRKSACRRHCGAPPAGTAPPSAYRMICSSLISSPARSQRRSRRYTTRMRSQRLTNSGMIGRIEENRAARTGKSPHQEEDLVLGADIDAARRVVHHQHPATREKPFRNRNLLLVSAAERTATGVHGAGRDVDEVERLADCAVLCIPKDPAQSGEAANDRKRDVSAAGQPQEKRFCLAVLRDEAQADMGLDRVPRRRQVTLRPSISMLPPSRGSSPKAARKSSSCPMPCNAAIPKISPGQSSSETLRRRLRAAILSRRSIGCFGLPRGTAASDFGGKASASVRPMTSRMISASDTSPVRKLPTSRPLRRTVRESQIARTSGNRCEMKRIVVPAWLRRRISWKSQSRSRADSAEVGSSRRRILGS